MRLPRVVLALACARKDDNVEGARSGLRIVSNITIIYDPKPPPKSPVTRPTTAQSDFYKPPPPSLTQPADIRRSPHPSGDYPCRSVLHFCPPPPSACWPSPPPSRRRPVPRKRP